MLLQTGDIIRLTKGMKVFTTLPAKCFSNDLSNELLRRDIRIGEKILATGYDTTIFEGEYLVVETKYDGGSEVMTDEHSKVNYPNGYHVFARRQDDASIEVDFYQSGFFLAMIPNIMPI